MDRNNSSEGSIIKETNWCSISSKIFSFISCLYLTEIIFDQIAGLNTGDFKEQGGRGVVAEGRGGICSRTTKKTYSVELAEPII